MPILRDGEKYACKQCIQGHRVSGCNHTDRPLLHVNKKGRPVSQCPHCRGLRKARQTHVKCECGERRHSRNTSSESASLDESGCSCYAGKKCTCALKKDTSDAGSYGAPSPENDRNSPMRWIPARRSESAIPRLIGSSGYKRRGSQDLGVPYTVNHRPYQLGRAHHAAQRSVDSLPLAAYATASQYQAPAATGRTYDTQYLMPDNVMPHLHPSQSLNSAFADSVAGDFTVHLDQTTIDRTLSPHNTKRYSMNDFSMLAGMSHHSADSHLYPSSSSDAQAFPFPDLSNQDFSFPNTMNDQGSRFGSVASADATFPALSRSSSGTASEPLDWVFAPNDNKSSMSQPVITIDPSWNFQPFEGSEKSAYEYTPSSYQGTPSDYTSPFDDPTLPAYSTETHRDDLNPFSTEPRFGGVNDFPFPGIENAQGFSSEQKTGHMAAFQVLPDRSAHQMPSTVPDHTLDQDFKFPNNDLSSLDSFAGSPLKQGWSPYSEEDMD